MANGDSCLPKKYGAVVDCTSLKNLIAGLTWELKELSSKHQAGERMRFDLILHKEDNLPKRGLDVFLFAEIGNNFRVTLLREALTEFVYSRNKTQVFHVNEMVGKNIGGEASLVISISKQNPSPWGICSMRIGLGSDSSFQINSDHVDLDPPAVIGIRYSKESYWPGENVRVYIEFSEELKESETKHITFKNSHAEFPKYSELGFQLHRTNKYSYEYAVEFTLEEQVQPGEYLLHTFNRQDIFSNFVSDVETNNLPPLVVRGE
ncbi:MAG: hypothetical protein WCK42_03290 [Myxococcaceae bacterium]